MKYLEKLKKLKKREKAMVFFTGFLLIIWISYSFVGEPVINKWGRVNKDVKKAKIELQKAIKIYKQKENVNDEYGKLISKFSAKGSNEEEMAAMLNEIELVARQTNVRIINMKPRRTIKKANHRLLSVDIDTESTMRDMLKFIKLLKTSKQSLRIEQITLNSRARDPSILIGKMTTTRLALD